MTFFQAFVLGLLQGATEFVPISSSAHLTLLPWLLRWAFDPVFKGAFDLFTHWGTLVAVLVVFWHDLWGLALGGLRTLGGLKGGVRGVVARAEADPQGRLAWLIVIGSLPAALLGFLLEDFFESLFGSPRAVSILLLVTAGLLAWSEWRGRRGREIASLTWVDALWIGLGQAVAIAPGISRSGSTIAAALLRDVRREAAARFSFLLAVPVIVGAGVWQLKDLFRLGGWTAWLLPLLIGFATAAVAGYACIRFLLDYLRRGRLYLFAVYCVVVGLTCLVISFVR